MHNYSWNSAHCPCSGRWGFCLSWTFTLMVYSAANMIKVLSFNTLRTINLWSVSIKRALKALRGNVDDHKDNIFVLRVNRSWWCGDLHKEFISQIRKFHISWITTAYQQLDFLTAEVPEKRLILHSVVFTKNQTSTHREHLYALRQLRSEKVDL